MVVPVFLGMTDHSLVRAHLAGSAAGVVFLATAVHAASYLIVTGSIAFLVFERLGVNFLGKAWINVDLIWAVALIVTGIANLVI